MRGRHQFIATIAAGILLLSGCDGSTDEDATEAATAEETTDTATDTTTDTTEPAAAGALAILSPGEMLLFATDAMSSARQSNAFDEDATSLRLAEGDGDGDSEDSNSSDGEESASPDPDNTACSTNAEPMNAAGDARMSESSSEYAKARTGCVLDTPGSSESISGSINMLKGVICAFEDALGEELSYTTAGTAYEDVTVQITTDCFATGFVQSNEEEGMTEVTVNVTATELGDDDSFEKKLTVLLPMGNSTQNWQVKFISTEDLFAFHIAEDTDDPNLASGTAVSVDRSAGVMRYETISRKWGNHTRVLATGDFTGSSFSEFDSLELIWQRFSFPTGGGNSNGNTPSETDHVNAPFVTVKGNRNDGYMYRLDSYKCGFDDTSCTSTYKGGSFTNISTQCVEGAGACEDNTGIVLDTNDLDYAAVSSHFDANSDEGDITAILDWINSGDVLCFSEAHKSPAPNAFCEEEVATLDLARRSRARKKFYFRRTAHDNPRISGWANECDGTSSEVNSVYTIDGSKLRNSSLSAIQNGSNPEVMFNVLAARGTFWSDYDLTVTVSLDDTELASESVTTPTVRARRHGVAIPVDLTGFDATTALKVAVKGTLTCRTDSTATKPKAFSVNLSTPVMRLVFDR